MLFLGKIEDILNTTVNYGNNLDSTLKTLGFMASNTVFVSECKDVNYVQLNQGIYDEINMEVYDKEKTKNDIKNYDFPKIWHKCIVFHATFNNNNLSAGNFDYMISEVSSMIIKRRPLNSVEQWLPIFEQKIYSEMDSNEFNFMFTDYLVKNKKEYEYKLVPILAGGTEGFPIYATYEEDDHKSVNFSGIFICEPDSVYSTILDVNVTAQKNKPANTITTIGKRYPFVLCGTENNYYTGTVNGLFAQPIKKGEWNFENSWDFREKFNEFLLDGKTKLLKYYDGRMWLVNIYDPVINKEEEHEYKVITSFNWAEIGNVADVYSLYDNGFISYNPYTKNPEIIDEYDYRNIIYIGKVLNIDGNPIHLAKINLCDTLENVISTTSSNNDGSFSFSNLKDNDYIISITAQEYTPSSINLSVINHKPSALNPIILTKKQSESIQSDNREYYTTWKVLSSSNNEDFIEGTIHNNRNMPKFFTNTGNELAEVTLQSDFSVKPGDDIYIHIIGNCKKESDVTNQDLSNAGSSYCSIDIYTNDIDNENTICSSSIRIQPSLTISDNNKIFSSSSHTTCDYPGSLNMSISMEELQNQRCNLYPSIKSLFVYINGINIFKMGCDYIV